MEQIAIFGDLHVSRKCEDPVIKKHIKEGQENFFNFITEELKRRNIKTILFSGDIFDSRISVNSEALVNTRRLFKDKLKDFEKHIILGNHDAYLENDNSVTPLELFEDIPNLSLYLQDIGKTKLLGKDWLMVPWLINSTEGPFIEQLKKMAETPEHKDKVVIFGHFDMVGAFLDNPSMISVMGLDQNLFTNASTLTVSGHYHTKSINKKSDSTILYLGSPFPLTFANSDQSHGIWLIDENNNYEFIENTISPNFKTIMDTSDLDNLPDLRNSFVRFYIDRNKSPEEFLKAKMKIEAKKPLVLKTIPYKDKIIENNVDHDQKEANQALHMDMISLSNLYINKNEEDLPELKYYKNPKEEIMKRMRQFNDDTK